MPSWASSWARYIRGNVVSQHAAQLIRRFLSLTLSRSGGDGGESDDSASEAGEDDGHAAAPVSVTLEEARKIMTIDAEKASKRSRTKRDIRARWSRDSQGSSLESGWDTTGDRKTDLIDEYKKAARSSKVDQDDKAPRSK